MDPRRAAALLGVPPHATAVQIERAFRRAAFASHPDRGGHPDRFRQLLAARASLRERALPWTAHRPASAASGPVIVRRSQLRRGWRSTTRLVRDRLAHPRARARRRSGRVDPAPPPNRARVI